MKFDVIIAGAGFAGSVIAERCASLFQKNVLVIEKRFHIGGNCYDFYDENEILVQKYGPHSFHTDDEEVFQYLSNFTEWILFNLKVLAFIDGKYVPIPFNLNTLYQLFSPEYAKLLESKLVNHLGFGKRMPIIELKNKAQSLNDRDLLFLADFILDKVYKNYSKKQWELPLEKLKNVLDRVPIVISRDDSYHHNKYRTNPKRGYSHLFEQLLAHQNIRCLLNTDFHDVVKVDFQSGKVFLFDAEWHGLIIYTGALDRFFEHKYGKLSYRSLRFEFKEYEMPFFQDSAVVNYPNDYDWTRITEFKHFSKSIKSSPNKTIVAYEYPIKESISNEPFYPIPTEENSRLLKKYLDEVEMWKEKLSSQENRMEFIGRLAEYKYYDMWEVVKQGLTLAKSLF
ncbi:MAG: UDP-galactopyranose mutase [Promethearchaeota archaeon CR_4]|nr:MAG: UDP-galactopyranose mutase [Candidatus Lokiarchaeota archaeon CR_4]